jgi:hypothetical protein
MGRGGWGGIPGNLGFPFVVVGVGVVEMTLRIVGREEDWTERRVRVMSRGYVITTEVIPAIAPAVNRNGVVKSVSPSGINNYPHQPLTSQPQPPKQRNLCFCRG